MHRTIAVVAAFAVLASTNPVTPPPAPTETCSSSACADYINTCGMQYGGCYPVCSGYTIPTFSDPGCPITSQELRLAPTSTCSSTVCVDLINSCDIRYGACFAACEGYTTPSFTDPECATTTSTVVPTATLTTTAHRRKKARTHTTSSSRA